MSQQAYKKRQQVAKPYTEAELARKKHDDDDSSIGGRSFIELMKGLEDANESAPVALPGFGIGKFAYYI